MDNYLILSYLTEMAERKNESCHLYMVKEKCSDNN